MSFAAAVFWNCIKATARWRAEQKEFRPAFRDADLGVLALPAGATPRVRLGPSSETRREVFRGIVEETVDASLDAEWRS